MLSHVCIRIAWWIRYLKHIVENDNEPWEAEVDDSGYYIASCSI